MSEIERWAELFGKPVGDPAVEALLGRLGIEERPRLPSGEYTAYLSRKEEGFTLVFRDEAVVLNKDVPVGRSPLLFLGAFLYSEGKDGFAEYADPLPEGLVFGDPRETVLEKLGPSDDHRERRGEIRTERWNRPTHILNLEYAKGEGTLRLVYFGLE